MVSKIRLQGRSLLIGATALFSLTLAVSVMLVYSLNLLPVVYKSAVLPLLRVRIGERASIVSFVVSVVVLIICALSYCALKMGSDRYMLKKAQNVHAGTKDIFCYFAPRKMLSLALFSLRLFIIKFSLLSFCNIPTVLCGLLLFSLSASAFSAAVSAVLFAGLFVFALSGCYFYFQLSASFFLMRYYFIKGEYVNFRHLISSSQNAMKNRIKELTKLKFSFSGWFMLCVLIFPIGYVWGYYRQTLAAFANEMMLQ